MTFKDNEDYPFAFLGSSPYNSLLQDLGEPMASLSELERRLIVAIQLRGNVPYREIARVIHTREHTVRYHVERLMERGIIRCRSPFINVYPLGYTDYQMFFTLAPSDEKLRTKIIQALSASPHVSWVAQVGGEFEYATSLLVKHVDEVAQVISDITKKFGPLFQSKSAVVRRRFTAFVRKYLDPSFSHNHPELTFGSTGENFSVDETDHKILQQMANTTYDSHRELARNLSMNHATLDRRVKSLEQRKIISGYFYQFDLSSVAMQNFRILVSAAGIDPNFTKSVLDFCRSEQHVIRLLEGFGVWDFELDVEVPHAEEVSAVVRRLRARFGTALSDVKLLQIFRHIKYSSYPFSDIE